jgi:hypothetical protein
MLRQAGHIAIPGRIVHASLIAVLLRRHNGEDTKRAIGQGPLQEDWKDKPAKLRQKNGNACWTVKFTKATPRDDGSTPVDPAIPLSGCRRARLRIVSLSLAFSAICRLTRTAEVTPRG